MAQVIYKYSLAVNAMTVNGPQWIRLPHGARILTVQTQAVDDRHHVVIWARVDTNAAERTAEFWLIGTGFPMPDITLRYVGTVQHEMFGWHVYVDAHAHIEGQP